MTASQPQAIVEFTDWTTAESTVIEGIGLTLTGLSGWWFIRKRPAWRFRFTTDTETWGMLTERLDELQATGAIAKWTRTIYEPETHAFGGADGMRVAHELFTHDSRHLLDYFTRAGEPILGRRELAIVLAAALMQGARLDWFEQGDVWHRFAEQRPASTDTTPIQPSDQLRIAMRMLMAIDTSNLSGKLASINDWIDGFRTAGRTLADLADKGRLERGLRAVLGHHLLFAYNRLGLPYNDQHHLSLLATEVVMDHDPSTVSSPSSSSQSPTLKPVQTITEQSNENAQRLRQELTDRLRGQGAVRTDRIADAFAQVPRHVFVRDATPEQAYADTAIFTKHSATGEGISAISQPTVVALMLEQAQPQPGERVLELGAGTGYNASLLAHLVGENGHVVTIDVDEDIVDGARTGVANAGYENVKVLLGDGALGHPAGAPYDLIIATVGAHDLPTAWLDQLAPTGRIVVPLRLRGTVSRSLVLRRNTAGRWHSTDDVMCTFMPLRGGIADDPRQTFNLAPDGGVALLTNAEQGIDPSMLAGVLNQPRTELWTDVYFGKGEPVEYRDLWLTSVMPTGLSRMPVTPEATASGLVAPEFPWGAGAVVDGPNLAYLTTRRDDSGEAPRAETGVIAHGPNAERLADKVAEQIRTWDTMYRTKTAGFAVQLADQDPPASDPGTFVFDRANTRLIITWQ